MQLAAYKLDERLARGGMGEVWTGTHLSSEKTVVIKVLTEEVAREEAFQDLFRQEVQATARLQHPNVISIFDYGLLPEAAGELGLEPGSPYYVMEFVDGGSLARFDWNYSVLRRALLGILSGLAHSHSRGILHLDMKPANVLWTRRSGGAPRIVVTDFGLAQAQERVEGLFELTDDETTGAAGTPPYMAPEQFFGAFREFGPWTDLYAVGILAFEVAAGFLPFKGPTIAAFAQQHTRDSLPETTFRFGVPDGFRGWIEKAVAKGQRERFQNAAAAARALEALGEWTPSVAIPWDGGVTADTLDSSEAPTLIESIPTGLSKSTTPAGVQILEEVEVPKDWREVTDVWVRTRWIQPGLELLKWRTPPFVARGPERDRLWGAFSKANSARKPRAVVIRGMLGTGKTRLASWLLETVRSGGYATTVTALHERSASLTHGLAGMMAERYRCLGLTDEALLERVTNVLAEDGIDDPIEAQALAQVMSSGRREAESGKAAEMTMTSEARIAVVKRALLREAKRGPLVFLVDDAQWGRDAIAVANQLLDCDSEEIRLLIVMTVRDESANDFGLARLLEDFESRERSRSMRLENLDRAAARELVQDSLALKGDVADLVVRTTAGNPLFATQLVQHWIQTEELTTRGSEYVVASKTPTVPEEMTSLWSASVDHLIEKLSQPRMLSQGRIAVPASEETLRTRIEVAAALGVHVDLDEWELACKTLGVKGVWGLVDEWVSLGMGIVREGRFSFTHGLLRESICIESRTSGRWQAINRAVADALAELYDAGTRGLLPRLARHYLDAEAFDETERLLADELDRQAAFGYSENEHFHDLQFVFERVGVDLEDPRWIDFWMLRGEILAMSADERQNAEGRELLDRALQTARAGDDPVKLGQALRFAGWCRVHGGDSSRGAREIQESVELLRGHREESLSLTFLSLVLWYEEDWAACEEAAVRGLETAVTPIQEYYGHQMLAHMSSHHGDYEQAVFHVEKCSEIAHTYAMTSAIQITHSSAAAIHFDAGNYETALGPCLSYVEMSDRLGRSDRYSVVGLDKLGRVLALLGRYEEAIPYLLRAHAAIRRSEGSPDARVADALLLCAVATENETLFEDVFEEALVPPASSARSLYMPVVSKTLERLREHTHFERYSSRASALWAEDDELLALLALNA